MTQHFKDWIHYGSAMTMLISAIVLSFLSFLILHLVHGTVLMYVSLCIIFAAGVYGITLYFNNSLGQFSTNINENIKKVIKEEMNKNRE